jgi:septum formation protein
MRLPSVFDLYLASQSPRRAELLSQLSIRYKQFSVDVNEEIHIGEKPDDYISRVTLEKLKAAFHKVGDNVPVLVADTIVVADDIIMGKPASLAKSKQMLRLLSGRWHKVYTMIAVAFEGHIYQDRQVSEVKFRDISDAEIHRYWASGEPEDKAGSYGVQGLGAIFVETFRGSYTGIMGLPHFETAKLLEKCGIEILRQRV